MCTLCVADRLEEHASTADDHAEDRRKSPQDTAQQQCAAMRRAAAATGASAAELRQLAQRLLDIDRSGQATAIVAQGHIAADRLESAIQAPDLGDGALVARRIDALRSIDLWLLEPLDPAHDKKWYARWKFWSFLVGAAAPEVSLALQGLALRPTEPGDVHAGLAARARKLLESWRRTSGALFWGAFESHVRQHSFSLETQAYLLHCIAAVFAGDSLRLSKAQGEQLAVMLGDTDRNAPGTSAAVHSAEIYRRLAQGLEGTDRETLVTRELGRGDAAQLAMTVLFAAMESRRASG